MNSCNADACDQGKKSCPCPAACQISEGADQPPIPFEEAMGWVPTWSLVALVLAVFVAVMVAAVIGPV